MGAATVALVNVTRGGKKPLSVAYTSSFADALGVFVPMPVWAAAITPLQIQMKQKIIYFNLNMIINLA